MHHLYYHHYHHCRPSISPSSFCFCVAFTRKCFAALWQAHRTYFAFVVCWLLITHTETHCSYPFICLINDVSMIWANVSERNDCYGFFCVCALYIFARLRRQLYTTFTSIWRCALLLFYFQIVCWCYICYHFSFYSFVFYLRLCIRLHSQIQIECMREWIMIMNIKKKKEAIFIHWNMLCSSVWSRQQYVIYSTHFSSSSSTHYFWLMPKKDVFQSRYFPFKPKKDTTTKWNMNGYSNSKRLPVPTTTIITAKPTPPPSNEIEKIFYEFSEWCAHIHT